MEIRALILVNTESPAADPQWHFPAALPGLVDVAGRSALERLAQSLEQQGVSRVAAIIAGDPPFMNGNGALFQGLEHQTAPPNSFWRASENAFNDLGRGSTDIVLLIRLGAYLELDVEKFVQCHMDGERRVTRAVWGRLPLDAFGVYGSRRNDAASLFRSRFRRCRSDWAPFAHEGYVNPMASSRDLRQFAIDMLTLKTQTRPVGREIRPGVWVAAEAAIDKGARLVAPVFVGSSARIRAGAVVTRCATIEHHAEVDCGTVVENSTLLPYSSVGAGLDLAHSVAGMGQIANLRRDAMVEVADATLFGLVPAHASRRLLGAAAGLPRRVWEAIASSRDPVPRPQEAAEAGDEIVAARNGDAPGDKPAQEFAPTLAVATRRYGNQ